MRVEGFWKISADAAARERLAGERRAASSRALASSACSSAADSSAPVRKWRGDMEAASLGLREGRPGCEIVQAMRPQRIRPLVLTGLLRERCRARGVRLLGQLDH